jgi:hypothetical protein
MCECIANVNDKLAEYNGTLETNLLSDPPRALISVCKRDTKVRRKPPLFEASFCPFCGEQYRSAKDEMATVKTLEAAP